MYSTLSSFSIGPKNLCTKCSNVIVIRTGYRDNKRGAPSFSIASLWGRIEWLKFGFRNKFYSNDQISHIFFSSRILRPEMFSDDQYSLLTDGSLYLPRLGVKLRRNPNEYCLEEFVSHKAIKAYVCVHHSMSNSVVYAQECKGRLILLRNVRSDCPFTDTPHLETVYTLLLTTSCEYIII